jgi:nicotinate-nucleotide pyrophosphorylase (carboxylating)
MIIPNSVKEIIKSALKEDIGNKDITSSLLIPANHKSTAIILAKEDFIVAGMLFVKEVFAQIDKKIKLTVLIKDGTQVKRGDKIAKAYGKTRSLLAGERVCLNFLQRLSGIATLTNMFVKQAKGFNAKILDTRKTTPDLRFMEKYAVRAGGGTNHRFGLYDRILIKDNHIKIAGSVTKALVLAKKKYNPAQIEIEVKNLQELDEALRSKGAGIIMLDNMSVRDMVKAVKTARKSSRKIILEASGNVNLKSVREIASTGVDWISVGSLTHSAKAADISMKIVK